MWELIPLLIKPRRVNSLRTAVRMADFIDSFSNVSWLDAPVLAPIPNVATSDLVSNRTFGLG